MYGKGAQMMPGLHRLGTEHPLTPDEAGERYGVLVPTPMNDKAMCARNRACHRHSTHTDELEITTATQVHRAFAEEDLGDDDHDAAWEKHPEVSRVLRMQRGLTHIVGEKRRY